MLAQITSVRSNKLKKTHKLHKTGGISIGDPSFLFDDVPRISRIIQNSNQFCELQRKRMRKRWLKRERAHGKRERVKEREREMGQFHID